MDTRTSIYFNLSCAEILFLRLCVVFFLPLTSPTAQIKHHVRMYVIRSGGPSQFFLLYQTSRFLREPSTTTHDGSCPVVC
jgi:hypothetical protein